MNFSLPWRSLHAQEQKLLKEFEEHGDGPEGEQGAFAGNDLIIYLIEKTFALRVFAARNIFWNF